MNRQITLSASVSNKTPDLSDVGLALEELCVQATPWGVELGVQENTSIGYRLQRGGAFIWERQADKNLPHNTNKKKKCSMDFPNAYRQ